MLPFNFQHQYVVVVASTDRSTTDHDDDDDDYGHDDHCPSTSEGGTCHWNTYYNQAMHADNVIEVDVPIDVVADIRREYQKHIEPHLETNRSTDDFCLVSPYSKGVKTWNTHARVDDIRSDIKWYSVNNEAAYQKYLMYVKRLGLLERVKEHNWIRRESDDDLTVYSIFFIPRSFSRGHQFHVDWNEELGTQTVTFLVPLSSDFSIGLAYEDNDDEIREYNYKLGKAIGVGGGLLHSTGIGKAEENAQDVLLCVYIGGKDEDLWEYTLDNIADELEHYNDPFQGFIRNENLHGRPSKCQ